MDSWCHNDSSLTVSILVSETLATNEAKHLLQLCKTGRLFEVQNWIASSKSLCLPADIKTTPLEVALGTGFHSLVELLVRNESSQELKNRALGKAVSFKRLDLIELLVANGAEPNSVPFIEVLEIWEPNIIRYFLDHGADFIKDSPFAVAFGAKIRTAINPWRECKEKYPDAAAQLQEQGDRALRHFCFDGNLKWVSLLMWAGADPRTSGPTLDDAEDESEHSTALNAAAYCKDVEILKRLKPDAKRDDLVQLLITASGGARSEVVRYLIELGANPDDKPNGGSSALDECLERFGFESFIHDCAFGNYSSKVKTPKYSVSKNRATIQLLLEHGALWRPDDATQVARVRRSLLECEPNVTLELVQRLTKHSACTHDTIHELLRTPAMKKHVEPVARKFFPMGFDIRTSNQKAEEERQRKHLADGLFLTLCLDTTERKSTTRFGMNQFNTWLRHTNFLTLVLQKFARGSIFLAQVGVIGR
jgi:hypothetical protein